MCVQFSLNFQTESLPTFSRSFSQRLPRGWNSHLSSFGELSSLCGVRSAKSGRACAARWSMEPSPLRKQRKCSACSEQMEVRTGTLKYQRSCASLVIVAQESGWMRGLNSLTASLPSKSTSKQHRCFSESERHTTLKGILETSRRSSAWLVHTYLYILLRVVGIILIMIAKSSYFPSTQIKWSKFFAKVDVSTSISIHYCDASTSCNFLIFFNEILSRNAANFNKQNMLESRREMTPLKQGLKDVSQLRNLTEGWLPPFRGQTQNSHKREICTLGGIFVRHFGFLVALTGWRI